MNNSFKFAFLNFVNQHQLIERNQHLLVAVSGGADSMVLLHLLRTWQKYFALQITVAHFNHQLRGAAADADEQFVQEFCKKNNLPVLTGRGNVKAFALSEKQSPEAAARMLRERFLREAQMTTGSDSIVTGHHLDDQIETLLMRLLSGSGLDGLAGIRLRRDQFLRPLLFARRQAIVDYAEANQIAFVEDASNQDLNFRRNQIRHQLIPFLNEHFDYYNPASFLNIGLLIQEWLPYIENQAELCFLAAKKSGSENKIRLDIPAFKGYFSGIQIKALELALSRLCGEEKKITTRQFLNFSRWLNKTNLSGEYRLDESVIIRREKSELIFEKRLKKALDIIPLTEIHNGESYLFPELGISLRTDFVEREEATFKNVPEEEYLDAAKLTFPLFLRSWQAGDRFQPLGMKQKKKISDFLIDEKQLRYPKKMTPVLLNQSEIICIPGMRISENYKIKSKTEMVLKIKVTKL